MADFIKDVMAFISLTAFSGMAMVWLDAARHLV